MSTQNTDPEVLAARADVVVLPGDFTFDVAPPVLFVEDQKTYVIRNLTRYKVRVRFPAGSIEDPRDFTLEPKGAAGNADRHSFLTKDSDEAFEYTVDVIFTEADSIRATGGSNPKIVYN